MVYSACRRPDASLPGVISCKGVNTLNLRLLLPWRRKLSSCRNQLSGSLGANRLNQCSRRIAYLFLHRLVGIQFFMAQCVGFPVADIPIQLRQWTGGFQMHVAKPV